MTKRSRQHRGRKAAQTIWPRGDDYKVTGYFFIFNCQWSEYGSSFIDSFFVVSFLRIFLIVHDSATSLNAQLLNLRFPSV